MAKKEKINVIESDKVFLVFNESQTIFGTADSIEKAYIEYKEKLTISQLEASKYRLNFGLPAIPSLRTSTSRILTSKKFIIAIIISALILGNIFSSLNQMISGAPDKIKNGIFYADNGEPRCYVCNIERVVDALNTSFDLQTEDDLKRVRLKFDKLAVNWKRVAGGECDGK